MAAAAEVLELEYFFDNNETRLVSSLSTNTTTTETETRTQIDDVDLRRGPWTVEEDLQLINYIAVFGEGRWNSLARRAGLKRTGKSCRLRWLNYLRPDLRRGNMTPEEQLLILQLHSRWGNRWSKIAQEMPGRTDNEIKNYWRTRVQKHANQLHCDINNKQFKEIITNMWMPRLVQTIQQQKQQQQQQQELEIKLLSTTTATEADHSVSADHCTATTVDNDNNNSSSNWYCGGGTSGEYMCCNSGLISCGGCEYDDMVLQNHPADHFNFNVYSADEWTAVGHY